MILLFPAFFYLSSVYFVFFLMILNILSIKFISFIISISHEKGYNV